MENGQLVRRSVVIDDVCGAFEAPLFREEAGRQPIVRPLLPVPEARLAGLGPRALLHSVPEARGLGDRIRLRPVATVHIRLWLSRRRALAAPAAPACAPGEDGRRDHPSEAKAECTSHEAWAEFTSHKEPLEAS